MTPEQKAAFITAQSACAIAEIEAMHAENQACIASDRAPIFAFRDFKDIPNKYGLHHNAVVTFFED